MNYTPNDDDDFNWNYDSPDISNSDKTEEYQDKIDNLNFENSNAYDYSNAYNYSNSYKNINSYDYSNDSQTSYGYYKSYAEMQREKKSELLFWIIFMHFMLIFVSFFWFDFDVRNILHCTPNGCSYKQYNAMGYTLASETFTKSDIRSFEIDANHYFIYLKDGRKIDPPYKIGRRISEYKDGYNKNDRWLGKPPQENYDYIDYDEWENIVLFAYYIITLIILFMITCFYLQYKGLKREECFNEYNQK